MKERMRFRRGGYIIPSLFTTGNLLCGYIAVIRSLESEFEWAAIAIAIAAILDRLDGWVARLTDTTSDFGVQLDSLADIISFGLAPAVLIYTWALADLQKPWSLVPFLYLAAGAARLARFNVSSPSQDKRYFVGLPIPAAACALAAFVFYNPVRIEDPIAGGLVAVMVATVATLMVSKARYRSFKEIELKSRIRWIMVSMMALVYLLVATSPRLVLLALSFSYLLSGLFPRLSPQARQEPQTARAEGRHGGAKSRARRREAHLAIFDASTLLAKGVKEQLVERSFPVASMRLFSTRGGEEASLSEFNGEAMLVGAPDIGALGALDIAFYCGTREEGARYLEWPGRAGFVAIDLTTAANCASGVPLVNAVVNPDVIPAEPVLIATPHAISLFLSSLLAPLRECGLRRAAAVAFQPAAQSGEGGIEELYRQTTSLLNFQEVPREVFSRQLAYNLIPPAFAPDSADSTDNLSGEITSEVSSILWPSLALSVEVIRAPVFHCQSAMVHVELEPGKTKKELLEACRQSGEIVVDESGKGATPVDRAGAAGILLAGVSAAETESSFWMWSLCDDGLSGNGLNAVRIAETVLAARPRGRATT